jgi:hypothetical protein
LPSSARSCSAGRPIKSAYNAATVGVTGMSRSTGHSDDRAFGGRLFNWQDEERPRASPSSLRHRRAVVRQRSIIGEVATFNGITYAVVGKIRKKTQTATTAARTTRSRPVRLEARDMPRLDADAGTVSTSSSPRRFRP